MKNKINSRLKNSFIASLLFVCCIAVHAQPIKNIVIVHGAFADGSGFKTVYSLLTQKGYAVTIVQNPCTSLADDVKATNEVLDRQDGPAILVGHSWGGTVITQAGLHPKVAGLVYIEGFLPEVGETTAQLSSSEPAVEGGGALLPDKQGWIFYPKAQYHGGFAGDLSKKETDFMYDSQVPITLACFTTPVTIAAWKTKPTWGIVSTGDKSINPILLKKMYNRAGTTITEINASHVVYMSQPKQVVAVIIAAATGIK